MKILVTGANGFIGSNLCRLLADKGHEVSAMILSGTPIGNLKGIDCHIVEADVTKPETLKGLFTGHEVVYHLAALPSAGWSHNIYRVNYEGTQHVLEEAVNNGVRRLVFMSSLVVHGFKNFVNAGEETPLALPDTFTRPYIRSKIDCEKLLQAYKNRLEVVVIRPGFQIFGPNDMLTSREILSRIEKKQMLAYVGSGNNKLGYVYVDNLVFGLLCAGVHPKAAGNTYVIADTTPAYIETKNLFTLFGKQLGLSVTPAKVPAFVLMPLALLVDFIYYTFLRNKMPILSTYIVKTATHDIHFTPAKAMQEIGYAPQVDLEEGLRRTAQWYRSLR